MSRDNTIICKMVPHCACVVIYFSSTEHYEALGQQDNPNVYECIKNKKGKQ